MNNKGFAITTILYGTLILFLMLLVSMLGILSTYKDRLGKLIDSNNGARDIVLGKDILPYCVITYDANGGSITTESQKGLCDTTVKLIDTVPVKTDYIFVGWSIDPAVSNNVHLSGSNFELEENITLYAIWTSDATNPTCTLSANSSTITATYSDNAGGTGVSYYGWNSNYSGTKSTSKSIATGTHIYYVMDGAGNKNTCQIQIIATTSRTACPSGYETGSFKGGAYPCRNWSCAAPPCKFLYSGKVTTYLCASGYTKINNSYCYK